MKKFFCFIIMLFLISNISFATTEYIEFSSGEIDDSSIYLDSYEDYMNAISGVDEQAMIKEEYLRFINQQIASYDEMKRDETVRAEVIKADNTIEEYMYDNYGLYKIKYQPIEIKILEGEYKDKTYEISYILMADSYENINIKPVRVNQKINVIMHEEDGEIYPYATTVDSSVVRSNYTLILIVITLILIGIYLGKKSLKLLPQLILILDLILLVFVPEMIIRKKRYLDVNDYDNFIFDCR